MKNRHRTQQRARATGGAAKQGVTPHRYLEDEPEDEAAIAKRKRKALSVEGAKARHHLGKPGRRAHGASTPGKHRRGYDAGGAAGGPSGPLSGSPIPTSMTNFPIAPGVFLGKGPPPAPAPFHDQSQDIVDQTLRGIEGDALKQAFKGAFKGGKGDASGDSDSSNKRGGRIRTGHAGNRRR